MKKCPKCGKTYDDSWSICLSDSTPLILSAEPEIEKTNSVDSKNTKECPFCKELVKHGASVCTHCKKEIGASVIIQGIGALISLPLILLMAWLGIGLFYNLGAMGSDSNSKEYKLRADEFNKKLNKLESAFLKLTSGNSK